MYKKVLKEVQQKLRAGVGQIDEDLARGRMLEAAEMIEELEYIDDFINKQLSGGEDVEGMQPGDVVRAMINADFASRKGVLCIYEGRVDSNPGLCVVDLGGRNGFDVREFGIFVSKLVVHEDYVEHMTGLVYDPATNTVTDKAGP